MLITALGLLKRTEIVNNSNHDNHETNRKEGIYDAYTGNGQLKQLQTKSIIICVHKFEGNYFSNI